MSSRAYGTLLAVWSFVFACIHVAWALGWRGGMPDDLPPISERPAFLAYDLVSGALMFAAAAIAWQLGRGGVGPRWRVVVLRATLVGSAFALLRGVPALLWDAVTTAPLTVGLAADVWFTVAGVVGVLLWRTAREPGAVPPGS